MNNIYELIDARPFLSVVFLFLLLTCLVKVVWLVLRSLNMAIHGYPPAHCDGDGDPIIRAEIKASEDDR